MPETANSSSTPEHRWYRRIGPGLITACVVIGPGSILTSSKVGAQYGFSMSWIIVIAVAFMMTFTMLGARLGVTATQSPALLISQRAGRWLAIVLGVSIFFISSAFQFGNNLGVAAAFEELASEFPLLAKLKVTWVVLFFNLLSISFLFAFRNLYRALERLMMAFVGIMLICFAINLLIARPAMDELLIGLIPPVHRSFQSSSVAGPTWDISLVGLVGTTFVISAAYFQAYLVRQKGWGADQLQSGMVDARIGSIVMALITIMLISTAATELRGKDLASVQAVAAALRPAFGAAGHVLFCVGLFAAAYSSFLINSMIGGFILADGLGLGDQPDRFVPRILTVCVLLAGMFVALGIMAANWNRVPAIVAGQAVTVLAAPLVAGVLLWLTNRRDIMGEFRNGWLLNLLGFAGFGMLLVMAWNTAVNTILPVISNG
jgi:NRAMP (natural resistance-associated macrophage protein)-like metal ion transporter